MGTSKNFLAIHQGKNNCSKLNCLNSMSISKCSWQSSNSRSTNQSVQWYLDRNGGKGACCMVWLLLVIQLSSTFKPRWGSHSLLFGSYHFNKGVSRSNAKTSGLTAFRHWHQHSGPIDSEQLSLLFTFRACWYLCLSKAVYLHCSMCYLFLLYLIRCHVCSWLASSRKHVY